jgi:imidazolonepropionase-like amidohydrolase
MEVTVSFMAKQLVRAPLALSLAGSVMLAAPAAAQPSARTAARVLVIDSVNVVDPANSRVGPLRRIVIRGDRIVAVTPVSVPLTVAVDERISGSGAYAIPGLTDHHVHLVPGMSRALSQAARGGVTMVNSMAGDARVAGEYARQVLAKELAGPEIVYASVMAGPDFFSDPRFIGAGLGFAPGTAPWAQAVTAETDIVRAVAAARGSGAEVLKLYAMIDSAVAARLTEEAHRQGMRVVAHGAVFPARPLQLAQARVDILTHAPYLAWQGSELIRAQDALRRAEGPFETVPATGAVVDSLLRTMRQVGTYIEPTLFVFLERNTPAALRSWSTAFTKRAFDTGVPVLAGTDGLIAGDSSALPNIHRELQHLVNAGLSNAAALAAATSTAARAMGRARTHGVIAPGYVADIVLLDANPLVDISATTRIRRVLLRGVPIR